MNAILVYEIKQSPLHGNGVFARVDIPKNSLIMREAPLWRLTPEQGDKVRAHAGDASTLNMAFLGKLFTKLKSSSHTKIFKLFGFDGISSRTGRHRVQKDHTKLGEHALKAYVYNALGRDTDPVIKTILYNDASRFNHSCGLSADYRVEEVDGSIFVVAAKDIKAGEEITLQYTKPLDTYAERCECLKGKYDFSCQCALCVADSEERDASDARRQKIKAAQADMAIIEQNLRSHLNRVGDRGHGAQLLEQCTDARTDGLAMRQRARQEHVSDLALWRSYCIAIAAGRIAHSATGLGRVVGGLTDQLYQDVEKAMSGCGASKTLEDLGRELLGPDGWDWDGYSEEEDEEESEDEDEEEDEVEDEDEDRGLGNDDDDGTDEEDDDGEGWSLETAAQWLRALRSSY